MYNNNKEKDMNKKQYFYHVVYTGGVQSGVYDYLFTGEYDAVKAYEELLKVLETQQTSFVVKEFNLL